MNKELDDLQAECRALDAFLGALSADDWGQRTDFFDWTVRDEVMHLHLIDLFGIEAVRNSKSFLITAERVRAGIAQGIELSAEMRERFGHMDSADLRTEWRMAYTKLCDLFRLDSPERRIPWFGPSIRVRSFVCARQMEVWAHGQDIYDCLGSERDSDDRIRNVCDLGVRTFSWSFKNRGEVAPALPPRVILQAPSGAQWTWNPQSTEQVSGTAEDFALVVTQRRNIADTLLQVTGAGAIKWLQIAQCFAGRPENPPPPGVRRRRSQNARWA